MRSHLSNAMACRRTLTLVSALVASAALALAGCGGKSAEAEKEGAGAAAGGSPARERTAGARPAPQPKVATIPSGTNLTAALQSTVATDKNKVGDRIALRTTTPVVIGGDEVVPVGATINGEVSHVDPAGRVAGGAELTLRFVELVTPDGASYPISCEPFVLTGKGDAKESAAEIGGGAVVGGIVGGIAGGKDDIAKGAAIGAALGTGVAIATKGDQIVLPAGQQLNVTISSPVAIKMKPVS